MNSQTEAILDLTGCKYLGELHTRIKKALDFPDYYGENWSAFWDALRFECPVEYIRIIGEHTIPSDLEKHIRKMHDILKRCKEDRASYGSHFDFEIID